MNTSSVNKYFVCGQPGTGKTTLGNALAEKHGWTHFDCEQHHRTHHETFQHFLNNPTLYTPHTNNSIITWGFLPQFIDTVNTIIDSGYTPIWLTAKESLLTKIVIHRDTVNGVNPDTMPPHKRAQELMRAAKQSQKLLPNAHVIQVFHNNQRLDLETMFATGAIHERLKGTSGRF